MAFDYFSKNGKILPAEEAVIPLSSIEYSYGFGVYETLRVSNRQIYFLKDHIERLMESAKIIGLEHPFYDGMVEESIGEIIAKNNAETCNIKMLLIGAPIKEEAKLFIICLNPLFPDKKLYRDGATFITYEYERVFPHAKTLNMLQSYLAYRKAKESGAYDALLVNRDGNITEGTRTNFFCIKDKVIYTPLEKDILLGVTRKALLKVARENGYEVLEKDIKVADVIHYDGAFISSTSSKIVPIKSIDEQVLKPQSESLKKLMDLFDDFLEKCKGKL